MNNSTSPVLETALRNDAEEVARRTLRYKFGRLSNRKIVARIRAALPSPPELSDDVLLERWFAEYDAALQRLRVGPGVAR